MQIFTLLQLIFLAELVSYGLLALALVLAVVLVARKLF